MKITAIIPARYQSTRFPGKPLAKICGIPMIQHVYERVAEVPVVEEVIVATDDERIFTVVEDFGGRALMTSPDHNSGTDRIAEVAADLNSEVILNVQGDEPLIKREMIEQALQPFLKCGVLMMSTLKKRIESEEEVKNPEVVKVVTDRAGNALYFSRYPVPFIRGDEFEHYKHIGLYVYRRKFLLQLSQMERTPLEKAESLEQLRVLENGFDIRVVETEYNSVGVDRQEDIATVEKVLNSQKK